MHYKNVGKLDEQPNDVWIQIPYNNFKERQFTLRRAGISQRRDYQWDEL